MTRNVGPVPTWIGAAAGLSLFAFSGAATGWLLGGHAGLAMAALLHGTPLESQPLTAFLELGGKALGALAALCFCTVLGAFAGGLLGMLAGRWRRIVHLSASALLLTMLLAAFPGGASAATLPADPDDPQWCRACHRQPGLGADAMGQGAHARESCRDCHAGHEFDPHQAVKDPPGRDLSVLEARGVAAPAAYLACADCHEDLPGAGPGEFHHGKADPAAGPYCADCHGDVHTVARSKALTPAQRRSEMDARCVACHEDAARMTSSGLSTGLVHGFEHSLHARQLQLGSDRAPGCVDCHGGHRLVDLKKDGQQICARCHDDVSPAFVSLAGHGPVTPSGRPVTFWTQLFFGLITFGSILALIAHASLDLVSTVVRTLRGPPPARSDVERGTRMLRAAGLLDRSGRFRRFDVHQLLTHGLLASSFCVLVLTGFPISYPAARVSQGMLALFGGLAGAALVHRIAAVILIVSAAYHLVYLAVLAARRESWLSMVPSWKDAKDILGNLGYLLGLRRTRPRFERYSYFQKLDYWAAFWGVAIMTTSGLVRWFPALSAKILPTWVYEMSFVAHTDEALLATLCLFIWHLYNVHLRPAVFPMAWSFWHGGLTVEELEVEHGAQYDALLAKGEAGAPPPSSEEQHAA